MKRKIILGVAIAVVAVAFAFPLANLVFRSGVSGKLTGAGGNDPAFAATAGIFEKKCSSCHVSGATLPFYAGFPIASSLIRSDVADGMATFDFESELVPEKGEPVGEVALAKVEHSVASGSMPPLRYRILHWEAWLSTADKQAIGTWLTRVRRGTYATAGYPLEVQRYAIQPIPPTVAVDDAKVALGEKLFHDKRLSADDTISCASCHDLAMGGTDRQRFSDGVGGKMGDINSPTVFNAVFAFRQFWDGRAADLQEQAAGPMTNPIEMAAEWPQVIAKLEKDEALAKEFRAAYPSGFSKDTITDAIAEFERSLITPNSRFDRFLGGDANALTADEKAGHELFIANACATCHVGKALGGQSFERMGVERDYFGERGNVGKADNGRFNVTGKESDRHRFKVPTLRNVALTGPYFHDGSTEDLRQAVKTMAKYQRGVSLGDGDADRIAKFLNSLTGEHKGKILQ